MTYHHANDNDRRNQCVECENKHANRNMVCDACMTNPALSYGAFGDDVSPHDPSRHPEGVPSGASHRRSV